jgi:hypothetical protein
MAPDELTPEELEEQRAQALPAREVMTLINHPGNLVPPDAGIEITPMPPVDPSQPDAPMPDPGETT